MRTQYTHAQYYTRNTHCMWALVFAEDNLQNDTQFLDFQALLNIVSFSLVEMTAVKELKYSVHTLVATPATKCNGVAYYSL